MSKVPCGGFELDESLVLNDGKLGLAPGAGNVQSDWNENDSSSPAYILNKPESLGGGVTWFYASGPSNSMDIRTGKEWSNGASATATEIINAFNSGVVRCKITYVSCCGTSDTTGSIVSYDDSAGSTATFFIEGNKKFYQSKPITT